MTINGKSYSTPKNLNIKEGAIRFGGTFSTSPFDSTSNGLYVNSSNLLVYGSQGATTTLGAAGAMVNYSLDDGYDDGANIAVDLAALTFTGTHATNNVFHVSGSGSGNLIDITNTGSGKDIDGTGSAWYITAAGAALLTGITGCDTIVAAADLTIDATGTGTIKIGNTSTGAVTIKPALTATASLTITGTADATVLTVTAGDVTITNGLLSLDSDDTTQGGNLVIPSSTATTSNVISITCDDITTGAAIYIDSDNGASFASNGGYLHFIDGTNPIFTVGRYGATVIAGNAEGTASLTLTAGDLVLTDGALIITAGAFTYTAGDMAMGDGSITIIDADDAHTLSVTNNSAATDSLIEFKGSGTFTGTTTTSFMTITPSGLTTGTAVYLPVAVMTQGKGLQIAGTATLTSGAMLYVATTGDNSAITSGELATFSHVTDNINATVNKIGSIVSISSNRTVHGASGAVADDFDLLSLTRTQDQATSGTFASTGSVLYVKNDVGAGTITDTTVGIEVVMDAQGTGTGMTITHAGVASAIVASSAIATGTCVSITANSLSTGTGLLVTSSGTIATTGELVNLVANGATSATAILRISATALTSGWIGEFTGGGATVTNAGGILNLQMGAATDGAGINLTTSGIYVGTVGLIDINATQTTTGTIIDILNEGRTTGDVLKITTNTTGAGNYIHCYDGAATDFKVSRYGATTIAGNASGTAALTVSAGDVVVSSGNFELTTGTIKNTPQAIVNADTAIDVTHLVTTIANNAASAHGLADGTVGQIKIITCSVYFADATITPTNFVGTTIVLNAAGDTWTGIFAGTEWRTLAASSGVTFT